MKKILLKIAIVALMCCVAIGTNAYPISQETALQLVKTNRTLNNLSNSGVNFYIAQTDTIINNSRCRVRTLPTETWANGLNPMWLVFVDEQPNKFRWQHLCKYYYVPQNYDASSTDIPVICYDGALFPNISSMTQPGYDLQSIPILNSASINQICPLPPIDTAIPIATNPNSKLHVVIIAGGSTKFNPNIQDIHQDNSISFFNDTKYLYNVLREKYRIPKQDIHVLLASGGHDTLDAYIEKKDSIPGVNFFAVTTPMDLDGDNISDVDGPSNILSVDSLLNTLSHQISEKDHLMLILNTHGLYDVNYPEFENSFLLWGTNYSDELDYGNELNVTQLRELLDSIHCASQCLLLSACFSGKSISYLKSPNRVILTSAGLEECGEDGNYGFFIHKWTNALNEKKFQRSDYSYIEADIDKNGWVSMREAFDYACEDLTYEYNNIYYINELIYPPTPQYSSVCPTLGEDWAINHLPDPTALYIRDSNQQNDNGLDGYCDQTCVGYNASPDIVVSPIDNEPGKLAVKVTIRNRGYKQYDGTSRYLHLHWKPSTYSDDRSNWIGRVTNLMKNAPEFAILQIEDSIGSGGETTVETIWNLPPRLLDAEGAYNNTQFDILARVSDSSQPVINDHTGLLYPFKYNNLDDVIYAGNMATCRPNINKVANLPVYCQLSVLAGSDGDAVLHVMADSIASGLSLSLTLDSELALAATGEASPTLMQIEAGDSIIFSGLTPNAEYSIPVTCAVNPLQVTSATTAVIPLTITTTDGVVNEAAMMQVTIAPRNNSINPEIGEVIGEIDPGYGYGGGVITGEIEPGGGSDLGGGEIGGLNDTGRCLMMTNVSEPVSCQWTDAAGTVLGTADTLVIPDNASGDYTLTVTALSDNATASVTRTLRPISAIWNLSANGGDITVTLRRKACQGTTITVQPAIGNEQARSFQVEQGVKTVSLNTNDMASGQYMVSLYVNNILKETKQIIK